MKTGNRPLHGKENRGPGQLQTFVSSGNSHPRARARLPLAESSCPPYSSLGEGFLDFTAACKSSFAFYPMSFQISITPSFPEGCFL